MRHRCSLAVMSLLALAPACKTHPATTYPDGGLGDAGGIDGMAGTGGTTYVPDPAHPIVVFPVPTEYAIVYGITTGPDGNLWFTENQGDKIGRITTDGIITEFALPRNCSPRGIAVGPDRNLWFTESFAGKIGRITTEGAITEFAVADSLASPEDIVAGPDGALWFTHDGRSAIGRITTDGTATSYEIESGASGLRLRGIAVGPDGNLWFADFAGVVGSMTAAGTATAHPDARGGPHGLTAGADGNLWFTEYTASKIGRLTMTGTLSEFPIPTAHAGPDRIAQGPDGNLWFTEALGQRIGRITPSGTITEFTLPPCGPAGITTGPDGNIWFTCASGIGRLTP